MSSPDEEQFNPHGSSPHRYAVRMFADSPDN